MSIENVTVTAIADLSALRTSLTRAREAALPLCQNSGSGADKQASVCAIVEHADTA